jgi:hypothetical protein
MAQSKKGERVLILVTYLEEGSCGVQTIALGVGKSGYRGRQAMSGKRSDLLLVMTSCGSRGKVLPGDSIEEAEKEMRSLTHSWSS